MIGKILSHLLGNFADDFDEAGDARYEELMESEEGGWVIVNVSDGVPLSAPLVDPLEDLLIEHPSMSVYQVRCEAAQEEELASDEEEEEEEEEEDDKARSVAVRRHISWRLAAWGIPLVGNVRLLTLQRGREQGERRKTSRSALYRQNLAKTRFSPTDKRYGHLQQPCQRLNNNY